MQYTDKDIQAKQLPLTADYWSHKLSCNLFTDFRTNDSLRLFNPSDFLTIHANFLPKSAQVRQTQSTFSPMITMFLPHF